MWAKTCTVGCLHESVRNRNRAGQTVDLIFFKSRLCTLRRLKVRPVPPVPCKLKVEQCKFLFVQKFVRTCVNGALAVQKFVQFHRSRFNARWKPPYAKPWGLLLLFCGLGFLHHKWHKSSVYSFIFPLWIFELKLTLMLNCLLLILIMLFILKLMLFWHEKRSWFGAFNRVNTVILLGDLFCVIKASLQVTAAKLKLFFLLKNLPGRRNRTRLWQLWKAVWRWKSGASPCDKKSSSVLQICTPCCHFCYESQRLSIGRRHLQRNPSED